MRKKKNRDRQTYSQKYRHTYTEREKKGRGVGEESEEKEKVRKDRQRQMLEDEKRIEAEQSHSEGAKTHKVGRGLSLGCLPETFLNNAVISTSFLNNFSHILRTLRSTTRIVDDSKPPFHSFAKLIDYESRRRSFRIACQAFGQRISTVVALVLRSMSVKNLFRLSLGLKLFNISFLLKSRLSLPQFLRYACDCAADSGSWCQHVWGQ